MKLVVLCIVLVLSLMFENIEPKPAEIGNTDFSDVDFGVDDDEDEDGDDDDDEADGEEEHDDEGEDSDDDDENSILPRQPLKKKWENSRNPINRPQIFPVKRTQFLNNNVQIATNENQAAGIANRRQTLTNNVSINTNQNQQ